MSQRDYGPNRPLLDSEIVNPCAGCEKPVFREGGDPHGMFRDYESQEPHRCKMPTCPACDNSDISLMSFREPVYHIFKLEKGEDGTARVVEGEIENFVYEVDEKPHLLCEKDGCFMKFPAPKSLRDSYEPSSY